MGPKACLDRCGKSPPPPGFDPRTVQPIASLYTDYPIPVIATRAISEICKSQPLTIELVHTYRLTRNLEYTVNHTPDSQPENVKEVLCVR